MGHGFFGTIEVLGVDSVDLVSAEAMVLIGTSGRSRVRSFSNTAVRSRIEVRELIVDRLGLQGETRHDLRHSGVVPKSGAGNRMLDLFLGKMYAVGRRRRRELDRRVT